MLTNGSAYPPAEQAARLRGLGLPIADDRMFTPSSVAAELMSRKGLSRALILGNRGVGHALSEIGIETSVYRRPACRRSRRRVCRLAPRMQNIKDIEAACRAIWAGAKLFVASDVPFFATKQGRGRWAILMPSSEQSAA